MVTTLRRDGNTWSLELDAKLVEQLGFSEGTELQASAFGQSLVVVQDDGERRRRFQQSIEAANQQFGETFKRLAE